jgi:hypothetical protein
MRSISVAGSAFGLGVIGYGGLIEEGKRKAEGANSR